VTFRDAAAAASLAAALIALGGPPATAAQPSFPCGGTLNPTERVICADPDLAALDRAVAAAYRNKFDGLPVESADALDEVVKSLVITQKAWLKHRDSCGTDRGCIYKAYVVRKSSLAAGDGAKAVPCRDVVGAAQAASYVKQCVAVATETHPPCNADNDCELIISHNIFRCAGLGDGAPQFCAAYTKPAR
jgi:uncharacterized protein YecT (DUF1311 family)